MWWQEDILAGAAAPQVGPHPKPRTEGRMSGPGWGFLLGSIYLVLLFVFAVLSFRKGHWVLGLIGFVFPLLWIIGALLPSRYPRR
jgi:hypothetical protein